MPRWSAPPRRSAPCRGPRSPRSSPPARGRRSIAMLKLVASSAFACASSSSGTITGIRLVKPPNDSGQVMPATSATIGTRKFGRVAGQRDDGEHAGRRQHLVEHHHLPPPAAAVEPRAQQRPGHKARQRHRRDRRSGQRRAARALEHEQHDADREHVVGEARDGGGRVEERVAVMAPQAPQIAGGHALIVSQPRPCHAAPISCSSEPTSGGRHHGLRIQPQDSGAQGEPARVHGQPHLSGRAGVARAGGGVGGPLLPPSGDGGAEAGGALPRAVEPVPARTSASARA